MKKIFLFTGLVLTFSTSNSFAIQTALYLPASAKLNSESEDEIELPSSKNILEVEKKRYKEKSAISELSKALKQDDLKRFSKNTSIQLDGVKSLKLNELENCYKDFIGKEISNRDIAQISGNINNYYNNKGYVLSGVSSIKFAKDIIIFNITEGSLREVKVTGKLEKSKLALDVAKKIQQSQPFNIKNLDRYNGILEKLEGATIIPIFKKINKDTKELPKKLVIENTNDQIMDLDIATRRKTVSGKFSIENREIENFIIDNKTDHYNKMRANLHTSFYNLLNGDETLKLKINSDGSFKNYQLFSLDFSKPINAEGLTIGANISYGKEALEDLDIQSNNFEHEMFLQKISKSKTSNGNKSFTSPAFSSSKLYNIFITYPLQKTLTNELVLYTGFSVNQFLMNPGDISKIIKIEKTNTIYNNFTFAGIYKFTDSFKGSNYLLLSYSKGIKGLFSNDELKIKNINLGFNKFETFYKRRQDITDNLYLTGKLETQFSSDVLPSSEKISLGGKNNGRGFKRDFLKGDKGAAASLELTYNYHMKNPMINIVSLYGYGDAGWIKNNRTPSETSISTKYDLQNLYSVGIGSNIYFTNNFCFNIELSKPIKGKNKNYTTNPDGTNRLILASKPSLFFGAEYKFSF